MGGTGVVEVDFESTGIVDELSIVRNVICIVELVVKRRRPRRRRGRAHARGLGLQTRSRILVQMGGIEPGLVREPGKIKHLHLTGTGDGHAETSASGAE
jgi:hypothetical protein